MDSGVNPAVEAAEAEFDERVRTKWREPVLERNSDPQQVGINVLAGMMAERFGPVNAGGGIPYQQCRSCAVAWSGADVPCWFCGGAPERSQRRGAETVTFTPAGLVAR